MRQDTKRIQTLFERVVGLQPDERGAVLSDACAGNTELLREVRALVDAHDDAIGFMDAPTARDGVLEAAPTLAEGPGSVIGRYKLLELIGEGGFGRVFHAEQLEPVRRHVAIKVIKLGMDTRQVIARFEAERQALAMMDHAGIARVFDSGATATGRPYFVMELVRGVPITEYCDANTLTTEERLRLFGAVCRAVQHAHQKGVIHRDLKPSNILVTLHDGEPVPKVIDFGIAKATSARLTERTLFTELRQFVGTPEYVSPEQAEMSGLDVDTRADVYSLGVLLYELLVGRTPFDGERLRAGGVGGLPQMIRESEPPKPSTRFSTLGHERSAIAKSRGADADRLRKLLRGDLEWIVMRAIEKNRTRRYPTASALADDVERFLRDEPVEAGPPSAAYRLQKLIKRRRGSIGAAALVLVLLIAALVGTSLGMLRALEAERNYREQLDIASEERRTAEELLVTASAWLTQVADDVDRIAAGADPSVFGQSLEGVGSEYDGGPRAETVMVGTLANEAARSLETLMRALAESRGRETETRERLRAIKRYVERTLPESDPRRAAFDEILRDIDAGEASSPTTPTGD